jgi:eukaryotic-like serine/threonine-protein kinase
MLPPDTYLKERYRIIHPVGDGGFGNVYKAIDESFGCSVAIKEIKDTVVSNPMARKAFEREAKLLRSLKHKCLPRVTDYFFKDQAQYLVMDYIEGDDLAAMLNRRLKDNGPFTVSEVLPWADRILSALEYLHGLPDPIIHRDIKPSNIRLAHDGIYLLDFGLAKGSIGQMSTVQDGQSSFSIAGCTREYAPLEQLQVTGTQPQSDIYSLGATLYHLLTGKTPIIASIREEAIQRGLTDPLRPAHEANSDVPIRISQVIEMAMTIRWWDRLASVKEMRASLALASNDLVSTKPMPAEQLLPPEPPPNNNSLSVLDQNTPDTTMGPTSSMPTNQKSRRSWIVAGLLLLTSALLGTLLAFPYWYRGSGSTTDDNLTVSQKRTTLRTPTDLHPQAVASHPGVLSIAFSPDGSVAASASENNTVFLWETKEWTKKSALPGHIIAFSPDGSLVATGGADNQIRLLDVHSGMPIDKKPPFPITKPVFQMAFSADSGSLAVFTAEPGKGDTDIQVWDLRNNNHVTLKGTNGIALLAIAFSPGRNVLFSAAQDNKLRSWNLTEKRSEVLQTYPMALKALAFSADSKYLACASEDGTIKLWIYLSATRKWLEQKALPAPSGEITSLAFSPDGTTLVGTNKNSTVTLWDVAGLTSEPILSKQVDGMQRSPAFSSDPRMFLTVGNNTIWLWQ